MERIPTELTRLESVDSTNRALADLIRLGAPPGSTVISGEQTKGRGQIGREWFSPPGVALYVSFCSEAGDSPRSLYSLPFAAGLAVARTFRSACNAPASVRWPNDVLINGRKCAGVLVETSPRRGVSIIGCGLNINNTAFPEELEKTATSAYLETGQFQSLQRVERSFFYQINQIFGLLAIEGFESVLALWKELDETPGSLVRVRIGDSEELVEASGVNSEGYLVTRDGRIIVSSSILDWSTEEQE